MHIRAISQMRSTPKRASGDWGVYENSWVGIMMIVLGAIFIPQKI